MKRLLTLLLFSMLLASTIGAQDLLTEDYRLDTADVRVLKAEINNLDFFRDNEYSSILTEGYSLPGLWLQPKLTYMPIKGVKLELGAHMLVFDGANKYPNYVYHDIGTWKGQQYQHGVHALPWLRAQAQFRHLSVVLGDIYGGSNHGLIQPLYNPETDLSQDPEMGLQLLWDLPHLHADVWLNWQSYIFKEDSHQEAFTVGTSWRVLYNAPTSRIHWYSPIQLVIQHRGGEQDTTTMGTQTLCNASIGGGMQWNAQRRVLHHVGAQVNVLGTYQQKGQLWPFKTGAAFHGQAEVNLWNSLNIQGGYFCAPRHFVSLYGIPFFSTISQRSDATSHLGINTAYARVDYQYAFNRHYILGANVEAYNCWLPKHQEFNFSFGVYFRVNPSFIIKSWH